MRPQVYLTIGELAARTGCTAEVIRYYEREGVIPKPLRRGTGRYRQYREADVERLSFLHRARKLSFTLPEVMELIALADKSPKRSGATVATIARSHLVRVESKLDQLAALRDELIRVIAECAGGNADGDCRMLGALSERT